MTQTIEYQPVIPLDEKPPLAMGIRLRLSVMMFLEFAVWGAWFVVFNVYCDKRLHLSGAQVGNLYANVALGAVFSMMFAGQIADKLMPAQYLLGICHLAGAVLLYAMAHVHSYWALWAVTLGYALLYNPTLALSNTVAFANIPDAKRDFPTLRVLGTIGWIVAASAFDWGTSISSKFSLHWESFLGDAATTNKPLMFGVGLSVILGLFSFVLPNTPPRGDKGGGIPFIRALKLLGDPSFGIFFGITLFFIFFLLIIIITSSSSAICICIPLLLLLLLVRLIIRGSIRSIHL